MAAKKTPAKGATGKTVAGIKLAKKKPVVRRAHLADEKYTGGEPVWDAERASIISDEDFNLQLRRSLNYYNYHYTVKDLKPEFIRWLQEQTQFEVTKDQLGKIIQSPFVPMTACSIIAAHNKGMPLKPTTLNYLKNTVNDVYKRHNSYEHEDENIKAEAKPAVKVPTIQDRLDEKTSAVIGELEGAYDDFVVEKKSFKTYSFLVSNNVPQSQLGKYEAVYAGRRAELVEARTGNDEQLSEGYSHYNTADFKRIIGFIDSILSDIDQYRSVKKASKKVRAPRPVSKEKIVAKLKYARESKELKIVSINPADILNAQTLWCYDAKTRKLIVYHADSLTGPLGVKGTSITGFDTVKSIAKTLRKPEEKLKEFSRATKVELRKFMDNIKSVETKANGRINPNQILLKVS